MSLPKACTNPDEFLLMVKQFSENAEAFINNFKQLTIKVDTQEKTMIEKTDELLRTKQELEQSEKRWKTEYPERIGEISRVYRDETHKLMDEKSKVESELERLQAEVVKGKTYGDDLDKKIKSLQHQLSEQTLEKQSLADQVSSINQAKAKLVAEITKTNTLLRTKDNQIKERTAKIEEQDRVKSDLLGKNSNLETKLQEQGTTLKKIQNFAPELRTDDFVKLSQSLRNLWQDCYQAASRCFDTNIARPVLEDHQSWKDLKEIEKMLEEVPFPPSNELSAKRVRTAALMAVLADALVQHIFTPTYLLFNDEEIRNVSFHLATTQTEKEQFLRRVLNGTSEDKQAAVRKRRVNTVLNRVIGWAQLLLDDNVKESLYTSLSQLLTDATNLWCDVQRTHGYVETDTVIDPTNEWKWLALSWTQPGNTFKEHEVPPGKLQALDACLVLFPRVYVVTGSVDQPIFPGIILPRSATRAAMEEWDKIRQSNPMLGRPSTNRSMRPRRMTLSELNGARDSFLG